MTVPTFLQSSFFFNQTLNVTTVATIISDLTTILTGQVPAWTSPSAGVFKSPVDAAGRFMLLTVVATSATRLEWKVTDQNNLVVCDREIDIDGAPGDTVNYYTGQFHAYVEVLRAPTPEWAGAMMLDPDPYALNTNQNYVMGNAFRNTGGANDGQAGQWAQWFMIENGASANRSRTRDWSVGSDGSVPGLVDYQANIQVFPFNPVINPSGKVVWGVTAYQTYITDSTVPFGIIKQIAVDNSTLAFFRSTVAGVVNSMRMMLRVG